MTAPTLGSAIDAQLAAMLALNAAQDLQIKQLYEALAANDASDKALALRVEATERKAAPELAPPVAGWAKTYENTFAGDATDISDLTVFQSGVTINATCKPTDSTNSALQKPTLTSNVEKVKDDKADDGYALALYTRQAEYALPSGKATGWTNGRAMVGPDIAGPCALRVRARWAGASVQTKTAVMWWPSGGGWPWEVDFAETFGGAAGTDNANHATVGVRHHVDQDGDGQATEQKMHDEKIDCTEYHVFDLVVTDTTISVLIDSKQVWTTNDPKWLVKGAGRVALGKAMTGRREDANRTPDTLLIDYVQHFKPAA